MITTALCAGFAHTDKIAELTGDLKKATSFSKAFDAINKLALYYGTLNLSEQLALIATKQQEHLSIRELIAAMSQTILDNWVGFSVHHPIPGIAMTDIRLNTTEFMERLILDVSETIIGSAIMGSSFDMQMFIANELGTYAGGQMVTPMASYMHPQDKTPAPSTEQIKQDSLAPHDQHYLLASAAGQGKGQSPDFLGYYLGSEDPDDLMNFMLSVQTSDNQPAVQNQTKSHVKQKVLQQHKQNANTQGRRANHSISTLPTSINNNHLGNNNNNLTDLFDLFDPFQQTSDAHYFKGASLNPNSHEHVAPHILSEVHKLAHFDNDYVNDWGRPMPSMDGHPGVGELLIAGAKWEYHQIANDISKINNGGLRDRLSGFVDLGLNVSTAVSVVAPVLEGSGLLLRAATREVVGAMKTVGFFGKNANSEVNAVKTISLSASRPGEIAYGYGELSSRQTKILTSLPKSGRFTQLHKSHINLTDLAALTAKTGDEFALFTLGSQRIVVRGIASGLKIDEDLSHKLISQGYRWSGHTHPGFSDRVLMASGNPGDRATLQRFSQSRSVILNSMGRQNIFDLENDYLITQATKNANNQQPRFSL